MSKKKKLTPEEKLQQDFDYYLGKANETKDDEACKSTFWYTHMQEILPLWKQYLAEHPDELEEVLMGFAWHAYCHALKQR